MAEQAPPRKRRGRARALTPAREQAILLALRNGATRRLASQYAGMGESTFYTELARNPIFREAVEQAEAQHELQMVSRVKASANSGDWKAAAFWLERRRYDEWGPAPDRVNAPPSVTVEVRSGAGVAVGAGDTSSLGEEARLAQLAAAIDLVVRVGGVPLALGDGEVAPPVGVAGPTEVDEVDTP